MKKIMIYSKGGSFSATGLINMLKNNSSVMVLYVSLLCGVMTGSTLSVNADAVSNFAFLLSPIINADIKQYLVFGLFFVLLLWILSFLGGLSCFGTLVQIILLFLCGMYCATVMCYYIILYSFQGFLKIAVSVLPGTSLILCALIIQGNLCNKMSSLITSNVLYQGGEKIELKEFIIRAFFCFAAMVSGILINSALMAVFCKI